MFNIQTINCMQYSEPVVIEINTHTEHLVQKHNNFLKLKRSYFEKRKQRNKKEKLTESKNLTVKIAGRSNGNQTLVSETSHKQNHCRNHKAALNEKPTDSPQ